MKHRMCVQDFEVWVHLGCSQEEQEYSQPVHYNLEIIFDNQVLGCQTDKLEDAVDYVKIAKILKDISTEKKYHLIEHLNHANLMGLIEYLKSKNVKGDIKLSVKKIKVPVENLRSGVVFLCEAKL